MEGIVQGVVNALATGGLYALMALGIALIFGVMSLINFAQGQLVMVGCYMVVLTADAPLAVSLVVTLLATVALALLTELTAFRPLRGARPEVLLISSFAVAYLLQNVVQIVAGSRPRSVSFLDGLGGQLSLGSIQVGKLGLISLGTSIVIVILLTRFLGSTRMGIQMRAASEDFETARLMGIRANRVIAGAFAISGLLAASVSFLILAQSGSASITMGLQPTLIAFVATVVGGLGSLEGAAIAAFILGALSTVFQLVLPGDLVVYRDAFLFGAVILMLLLRPQGLMRVAAFEERV